MVCRITRNFKELNQQSIEDLEKKKEKSFSEDSERKKE